MQGTTVKEIHPWHRTTFRRGLGLGLAAATMIFGGAYAVGTAAVNTAAPVDERGRPDAVRRCSMITSLHDYLGSEGPLLLFVSFVLH